MRADAPGTTRPAWRMFHRLLKTQSGLEEGLRTGNVPLHIVLGGPLFEYLPSHPEEAAIFDAGMTAIHGPETQAMLNEYDFGDIGTLADIGGGNGSLLIEVLKAYPQMKGLLFDLGHVIGRARANVEGAGVAGRCQVQKVVSLTAFPRARTLTCCGTSFTIGRTNSPWEF
ncbi:MAG: methyltransferase [Acidobacteriota bacterium]